MPPPFHPSLPETSRAQTDPLIVTNPSFLQGILAGVAAGIAGTVAMDLVSAAWSLARPGEHPNEGSLIQQGGRPEVEEAKQEGRHSGSRSAVATTKLAETVGESILKRPLTRRERRIGGTTTHYLYGAALGAAYGALASRAPWVRAGYGSLFGVAAWIGGVELALPALGLIKPPREYTAEKHLFSAVSHLAYGAVADQVYERAIES